MGKTWLELSWVQGLRRISGPGFVWVGLQGSLCWLQGRDCAVLAGGGASSPLLLGHTLFPTFDFSLLSPKRVIDEHFSKASPHPVVPSAFYAGKSRNKWSPEVLPAQGYSFLLKHLCFALMPSEGVPGVWHLGPPKPLLGTEQISADVSL